MYFPAFLFCSADPGFFCQFPNRYFVETGSYEGGGIAAALRDGFIEIHSIELSEKYYSYCQAKFAGYSNVHLWHGDSGEILAHVIEPIQEPITFWLDGHFSGGGTAKGVMNTPLLQELEAIKKHPIKTHTIIIDDIRLLGRDEFDFIQMSEITQAIFDINKGYRISYQDGTFKNDILVAEVIPK